MVSPITRLAVVRAARSWLGTPYQHQASLKGVGADCLGLLRGIWRELIGPEPEPMRAYGPGWAELSGEEHLLGIAERHLVARASQAPAAGTVLIFRWKPGLPAKHCGIASAADRFIHAQDGAEVAEVALVPGWRRRIAAQFDFPGLSEAEGNG